MTDARKYIEDRSIPEPMSGCWIWLRALGTHGYGAVPRPHMTAHRAAFVAFKGPIPDGMVVMHSCDNHWCVCPDHLTAATYKANTADMMRKGRSRFRVPGFRSERRKLTAEQVAEIRSSPLGKTRLGRKFGVDRNVIRLIRSGQTYRDAA